jgi:hypothetical protein
MPEQPTCVPGPAAAPALPVNEWLKILTPVLFAALCGLLGLSIRGPTVGWLVFGYVVAAAASLFVAALFSFRSARGRHWFLPFVIIGVFVMCLAPLAYVLIPASTPVGDQAASPSRPQVHDSPPTPVEGNLRDPKHAAVSGVIYVGSDAIESRYEPGLIQALHTAGWQVTDDRAKSAVTLHVLLDVATKPGLSVGSTAT